MALAVRTRRARHARLPVFVARGSRHDVGFQLGARFRTEARRAVALFRRELAAEKGASMAGAIRYARKVVPRIEAWYPEFLEEMRGYAEGSGVRFDVLAAQWSGYDPAAGLQGCTDLAVAGEHTADGSVLVAHTEDYTPWYDGLVVPVHVKVRGEPELFAMSYGGLFPTMGFNAAGISMTGNAVSHNDTRAGIPKMVPPRRILDARTLFEALAWSMPEGRGSSFNNIVCSREGELYSMEGSATTFDAIYGGDGWLVHTNHYVSPKMWRFEQNPHGTFSSILRYNRATRLLRKSLGRVTPQSIMAIQRDHVGQTRSICRHEDRDLPAHERVKSLFGSIVDLTHGIAYVSGSTPCATEYRTYRLGA